MQAQAESVCRSVDSLGTLHDPGFVVRICTNVVATHNNPRIRRLLWYMLLIPVLFSVFLWLLERMQPESMFRTRSMYMFGAIFRCMWSKACKQSILITPTTFCLFWCVDMLCKFFSASPWYTLTRLCMDIFSVFCGGGSCVAFGSFFSCVCLS